MTKAATQVDFENDLGTVNAQTGTTYTIVSGDRGKLLTFSNAAAIAVTLPQAGSTFPNGWFIDVQNRGAGTATITPTTSTVDGSASIALTTGQGVRIFSDGTNYFTQRGLSSAALTVKDEGSTLTTAASSMDFVGAGVTATNTGGAVTVTIAGDARESLAVDRTYYVRTDGSDSNNGLADTSGGAFLTIQKAVDVTSALDQNIRNVTIQVADGTYTGAVVLKMRLGAGTATINGNSGTPANVIISVTSADAISGDSAGPWAVNNLKLQTTTSGNGLAAYNNTAISFANLNFGSTVGNHIIAQSGGSVAATGNYAISGGSSAGAHAYAISFGAVTLSTRTVTLTGTPSFATGFVWCDRGLGMFDAYSMTFSGSATGKRYSLNNNAVAFVNGAATTYFPGNVAGTNTNGAQYN